MTKRCFLFDLDGTLLHTLPTMHHCCNHTLTLLGLQHISGDQCRELARLPIVGYYEKLLTLGGCPPDEAAAQQARAYELYMEEYEADPYYLTEPFPGLKEALLQLRQRGFRLGVLTNKARSLADATVAHFFPGVFELVVGQTPESISKPDPRAMQGVLQSMHLSGDACVYVGDTNVDIYTGQNAGVDVCLAAWGYQPLEQLLPLSPTYVAHDPSQLLALADRFEEASSHV